MAEKYISVESVSELISIACIECKDACEESDGIYADCNQCLLHDVKKKLSTISAADVRPVVNARWEDETGYIFNLLAQRVYCPACKSYAYFYPITTKNFCPNCGADMRQKTDSSLRSE